jgi:dTDP-4-dehydrorhamnose reductase
MDAGLLDGYPTSALGQRAPRPLSAGLSIDKLQRLHPDVRMRTLNEALADCKGELDEFCRGRYIDMNQRKPGGN